MSASRRDFLKIATTTAALLAMPAAALSAARKSTAKPTGKSVPTKPRRVIFLVSDGMSMGVPCLAESFSQLVRSGKGTQFAALLARPEASRGFFETHSLNSLVTDSSSASSAWGSGVRVVNAAVNVLPDGRSLTPIMPLLKGKGIGTGIVTTATVTHATPAGFTVAEKSRDNEESIATKYLDVLDVILGGGRKFFSRDKRKDKADVFSAYAQKGYTLVGGRSDLMNRKDAKKLLGTFSDSHMPYTVDHINDPKLKEEVPTLAEMTRAALAVLEKNPKGFLLQVEGARVDHAAHGNDAAGVLYDQLAFDDAIAVAQEFAARNPDTLIVVTSDHGNSNPGLNGMAKEYAESTQCFERLAGAKASFSALEKRLGVPAWNARISTSATTATASSLKAPAPDATIAGIRELMGIDITTADAELIASAALKNYPGEPNKQEQSFSGVLAQVLGNYHGIGWTGNTHTSDDTIIVATGPGHEAYLGLMKNTANFDILCNIFGVTQKNPSMTIEEAKKFKADVSSADHLLRTTDRPHWA